MKSVFNPLGISEITMWTNITNKTIEDIKQFSAVYISGGNTFNLLNDLKGTNFDALLSQYLDEDGTIYGQSAGAIIFGKSIKIIPNADSNSIDLKNFDALNRIKDCCIWCHYKNGNDAMIVETVIEYGHPIIALPDGTAVILSDNQMSIIGDTPAYLFQSNKKELLTEESFLA